MTRVIDLSHEIHAGLFTHPGLPGPVTSAFKSRDEYRAAYGTEFQVDRVELVGNTGTYLDSPFHRFPDGADLASIPLESVVDLPILVVAAPERAVDVPLLAAALGSLDVTGSAVLLHTGGDAAWGREEYAEDAPFLTAAGAAWLAERSPALVGIDSVNIDDLADGSRPAHTSLLGARVLICEHLTQLAALPVRGARLHAAPVKWRGVGTWPVRAYALVTD